MSSYFEKLKDPRWQKRRLEVFEAAEFTCAGCGSNRDPLHAHHLIYRKGANPWDYSDREIICLCESCHREWHAAQDALHLFTSGLTPKGLLRVSAYAFGISAKTAVPGPSDPAPLGYPEKGPYGILGKPNGEWSKGLHDAIAGMRDDSNDAMAWLVLERLTDGRAQAHRQTVTKFIYGEKYEYCGEEAIRPIDGSSEAMPR